MVPPFELAEGIGVTIVPRETLLPRLWGYLHIGSLLLAKPSIPHEFTHEFWGHDHCFKVDMARMLSAEAQGFLLDSCP
jgi:hypothetical protein